MGSQYQNHPVNIAMSDSPFPFFVLEHLSAGLNPMQLATWQWNLTLVVAVGTTEVSTEDRPNPPGDRYPYFRRAVLEWTYEGTIIEQNGNYQIANASVTAGNQLTKVQNGDLVFDTEVIRSPASGDPIIANDALNNGLLWNF